MPDAARSDMSFNAAKLFAHIKNNLNRDPTKDTEWMFCFSHEDFEYLMSVAEHFADALQQKLKVDQDAIACEYNEKPNVTDERGKRVKAPPEFCLTYIGSMTEKRLASIHTVFGKLATKHKITYGGVYSF